MYELSRFWASYGAQLLFLLFVCITVYGLARFASARWPFALAFSAVPIYIFCIYQQRFWFDLMRLVS